MAPNSGFYAASLSLRRHRGHATQSPAPSPASKATFVKPASMANEHTITSSLCSRFKSLKRLVYPLRTKFLSSWDEENPYTSNVGWHGSGNKLGKNDDDDDVNMHSRDKRRHGRPYKLQCCPRLATGYSRRRWKSMMCKMMIFVCISVAAVASLLHVHCTLQYQPWKAQSLWGSVWASLRWQYAYNIAFVAHNSSRIVNPKSITRRVQKNAYPDYGGLFFESLTFPTDTNDGQAMSDADIDLYFRRKVLTFDADRYEEEREKELSMMDEYDDTSTETDHDDELKQPAQCQRNNWVSSLHINCNTFHELGPDRLQSEASAKPHLYYNNFKYLNSGYFRDAWLLTSRHVRDDVPIVMKQLRFPHDKDDTDYMITAVALLKVQREAIIMERLTASPRYVPLTCLLCMSASTLLTSSFFLAHTIYLLLFSVSLSLYLSSSNAVIVQDRYKLRPLRCNCPG
jgi:hypothetical protein